MAHEEEELQTRYRDLDAQLKALLAEHPELQRYEQVQQSESPQQQPRTFTRAELAAMSNAEYVKHRAAIIEAMNTGQLR